MNGILEVQLEAEQAPSDGTLSEPMHLKPPRFNSERHRGASVSMSIWGFDHSVVDMNGASVSAAVQRIREEVGNIETELANARLELAGMAESRKWVNWSKAFGDE